MPVSISDTHRGVGIYELVKTRSSGYQTEIYLSINRHQKSDTPPWGRSPDPNQRWYVRIVQIRLECGLNIDSAEAKAIDTVLDPARRRKLPY